MNCRTILRRVTHHAAHPIRHARHFVRAHYVASLVCTGAAIGSGFGGATLIRHEAPGLVAPAVHAAEASAPTSEFDLPASAFVAPIWAPAPFVRLRDDCDDRGRHRHHHKHHGSHPISTPEPGTLAVLLVGLVAVVGARRWV